MPVDRKFDPWTASDEEALDLSENYSGRVSPIFQWQMARKIESEQSAVESGNGFAVLSCIHLCVTYDLIAPIWLAYAFNRHYRKVLDCDVRSWDEAFGKPYPGKKLSELKQRRQLRFAVFDHVTSIIRSDPNRAIDVGLFEEVAEKFEIKKRFVLSSTTRRSNWIR